MQPKGFEYSYPMVYDTCLTYYNFSTYENLSNYLFFSTYFYVFPMHQFRFTKAKKIIFSIIDTLFSKWENLRYSL